MENNKNLEAVDEVINGMNYLIEQASKATTKSYDGMVVEKIKDNLWKIKINNVDHNVKLYGNGTPNINDMVKVFVPQGNYNLAWFFVSGENVSDSYFTGMLILAQQVIDINTTTKKIFIPPYSNFLYGRPSKIINLKETFLSYSHLGTESYRKIWVILNVNNGNFRLTNTLRSESLSSSEYVVCYFSNNFTISNLPSHMYKVHA